MKNEISAGDFVRYRAPDNVILQGYVSKDTPIEAGFTSYHQDHLLVIDQPVENGKHVAPNEIQDEPNSKVISRKFREKQGRPLDVVAPKNVVAVSPEGTDEWVKLTSE